MLEFLLKKKKKRQEKGEEEKKKREKDQKRETRTEKRRKKSRNVKGEMVFPVLFQMADMTIPGSWLGDRLDKKKKRKMGKGTSKRL